MKNDEFEKHCEGLRDTLEKNGIGGFYFFINDVTGKSGPKSAALSANNMDDMPEVFKDIFILLVCLNKNDASKDFKEAASKMINLTVKLAALEFKDEILNDKGEKDAETS